MLFSIKRMCYIVLVLRLWRKRGLGGVQCHLQQFATVELR